MKNKFILTFYLFSIVLIFSCGFSRDYLQEGFVQLRTRSYDSTNRLYSREAFMPDMNIWFMGSYVVEEIRTIKTLDSMGIRTIDKPIAYYLFIDRKSRSFYDYSSFSDTARIINKYYQKDSAEIRGLGGWSFYKNYDLNIVDTPRFLSDTSINKTVYKRIQMNLNENKILSPVIAYLRCDKLGTMFQFNKNLSNKLGCPIVRLDFLPSRENPKAISTEINFIRDSLSIEERKVFKAWKSNIKKYPISK